MSLATLPMTAQETYENAKLLGEDLNGTARYVGMGRTEDAGRQPVFRRSEQDHCKL